MRNIIFHILIGNHPLNQFEFDLIVLIKIGFTCLFLIINFSPLHLRDRDCTWLKSRYYIIRATDQHLMRWQFFIPAWLAPDDRALLMRMVFEADGQWDAPGCGHVAAYFRCNTPVQSFSGRKYV